MQNVYLDKAMKRDTGRWPPTNQKERPKKDPSLTALRQNQPCQNLQLDL
jgi:hypothetical protein